MLKYNRFSVYYVGYVIIQSTFKLKRLHVKRLLLGNFNKINGLTDFDAN